MLPLCLHFIFHPIELPQTLNTAWLLKEKEPYGIAQSSSIYLTYNCKDAMRWTCDIILHGEVQIESLDCA